nr:MAG TPA: hypothetical protein [Caudoviricetes sp.]
MPFFFISWSVSSLLYQRKASGPKLFMREILPRYTYIHGDRFHVKIPAEEISC